MTHRPLAAVRTIWQDRPRGRTGKQFGHSQGGKHGFTQTSRYRCVSAGTAFSAGSALAQTNVTFWQFFTGDTDVAAWRDTIAKFEAANPDIKINMELVPWAEQQQRFVTALASGGLPDISMLGNNVVAQFQATGSLAPLDDYFAAYEHRPASTSRPTSGRAIKGYYILDGKCGPRPSRSKRVRCSIARTCSRSRARPGRSAGYLGRIARRRGQAVQDRRWQILRHRHADEHRPTSRCRTS